MKKYIIISVLLIAGILPAYSQKYITKTGHIKFFSDSPLEKIEAHNRQVKAGLDMATGDFQFIVLMKSFEFEKALMQEHFNENYVESDKFPNATFNGKINNIKEVDPARDGVYPVTVEGKLTIHGVSQPVTVKGTLESKSGKMPGKAKFTIMLADYDIKVPGAVANNISKSIEIMVDIVLEKIN